MEDVDLLLDAADAKTGTSQSQIWLARAKMWPTEVD
jgi:hypothetical protein